MKDPELNPLDQNQRKILQIGVVLMLVLFLIGYFFWLKSNKITSDNSNKSVYLQNSKLHVFKDIYTLKPYPDRVLMHYPYFLIVQADKPLTTIYNLETKKKEKEVNDVLLDYYQGNIVYNRKDTYFNNQNMDEYCEGAFIKSPQEILCIVKTNKDAVNNMLISINPSKPSLWRDIYRPKNILTTVSVINDVLYTGEINLETKQNFISVNKQAIPVSATVNVIYPLNGSLYFASFKSVLNNQQEHYYIIKGSTVDKVSDNKIIFYK